MNSLDLRVIENQLLDSILIEINKEDSLNELNKVDLH